MTVVFVTNSLNHHQQPVADEMFSIFGEGYRFVEIGELSADRKQLGWETLQRPSYLTHYDLSNRDNRIELRQLLFDATVVIIGAAPIKIVSQRLKAGKLTFRYSERLYKSQSRYLKIPLYFVQGLVNRGLKILCASAYAAMDYSITKSFSGQYYKWGYFPPLYEYPEGVHSHRRPILEVQQQGVSILWVARLITWKHPEYMIELAKFLSRRNYKYTISIIGVGPLESELRESIAKNELEGKIELLGAMSPSRVRAYMEKSDVFLFTSDRHEGWGAVLNEAMNSGCAVVANGEIGSVPFLIKNGYSGLIFNNGDVQQMGELVSHLMEDLPTMRALGENAYRTISKTWNAHTAVKNFILLVDSFLNGSPLTIDSSEPCSVAEVLDK